METKERFKIKDVQGRYILNTKGGLAIEVCIKTKYCQGFAAAPYGTSVGKYEVSYFPKIEMPTRKKVEYMVAIVNKIIRKELIGKYVDEQEEIDKTLEKIDGTKRFERIGGGVSLSVSLAALITAANCSDLPLFKYINRNAKKIPLLLSNVIGGGVHGGGIDYQEILIIPLNPKTMEQQILVNSYAYSTLHLLEPSLGFGKELRTTESALVTYPRIEKIFDVLTKLKDEIYEKFGIKIGFGIDIAASTLYDEKRKVYVYRNLKKEMSEEDHFNFIVNLAEKYDIVYIEDPFHEDDFDNFSKLKREIGKKCLIVGDDIYATNEERLEKGIEKDSTNSSIVKPNQTGTITRTINFINKCKKNKIIPVLSHRSGTIDQPYLSHLAVGWEIPIVKFGIAGERIIKINELVRIEDMIEKPKTWKFKEILDMAK